MKMRVPYVVSPPDRIKTILSLIEVKPGQKSVDLGSGDGSLVIAMAKAGAEAYGFEIVKKYVGRARMNILQAGLGDRAFVHQKDFWDEDLSSYDIVTIYGMAAILDDLEKKLSKELRPGTIVVSNGFPIPGWKIWKSKDHIYVHVK